MSAVDRPPIWIDVRLCKALVLTALIWPVVNAAHCAVEKPLSWALFKPDSVCVESDRIWLALSAPNCKELRANIAMAGMALTCSGPKPVKSPASRALICVLVRALS